MALRSLGWLLAIVLLSRVSDAKTERPPKQKAVTRVHIVKSQHLLELFAGEERVAAYVASMGPGGSGPKRREGDARTPVGRYHVTMHQPSQYEVFLRLDYPNAEDWARFAKLKRDGGIPKDANIGGDIGIHGPPVGTPDEVAQTLQGRDWTLGCIAVMRDEIREIARLVPDGTVVDIED
jgi:murein L,D-transpeptidase YafK